MVPHSEPDDGFPETNYGDHDGFSLEAPLVNIPVLMVGCGLSGLLQAYMFLIYFPLTRLPKLCIQSNPRHWTISQRADAPKAHALPPRSLELCRQFELEVNHIRRLGTKRPNAYWVNFVTNITGHHVGTLPYERMDLKVLEDTLQVCFSIFPLAKCDIDES